MSKLLLEFDLSASSKKEEKTKVLSIPLMIGMWSWTIVRLTRCSSSIRAWTRDACKTLFSKSAGCMIWSWVLLMATLLRFLRMGKLGPGRLLRCLELKISLERKDGLVISMMGWSRDLWGICGSKWLRNHSSFMLKPLSWRFTMSNFEIFSILLVGFCTADGILRADSLLRICLLLSVRVLMI